VSTGRPARRTVNRFAAYAVGLLVLAAASGGGSNRDAQRRSDIEVGRATVVALRVVESRTPPLRVPRYHTRGTYMQVSGSGINLRAVNSALRAALFADQKAYAPYARREKPRTVYRAHGVYRTAVARKYLSASTAVVSALMPLTRELFPGQHEGDGWLAITVQVPSGKRVTISDLFANPKRGLHALAAAWKAQIRRTSGAPCLRIYHDHYRPTAANYRAFALTPPGLAVGSWELAACHRLVATVRYGLLRPYLSKTGAELIKGVRRAG
jgi:hypothetical protein